MKTLVAVLVVLVLALGGGLAYVLTQKGGGGVVVVGATLPGPAAKANKPDAKELETAWKKYRNKLDRSIKNQSTFMVAYYGVREQKWKCLVLAEPGWLWSEGIAVKGLIQAYHQQKEAKKLAADKASEPETAATVVINVLGKPNIEVVEFYRDSGSGVETIKKLDGKPSEALDAFLEKLKIDAASP